MELVHRERHGKKYRGSMPSPGAPFSSTPKCSPTLKVSEHCPMGFYGGFIKEA